MDNRQKDLINIANSLKNEIQKTNDAILRLEEDMAKFQGRGQMICWTGENAYVFVGATMAQIQHNRNLIENLNKCLEYVDSLINK